MADEIQHLNLSDKFRDWFNTINKIIDALKEQQTALDEKAPKNHASSNDTYGKGSSTDYGHVKLSDDTSTDSGVDSGTAATPSAVKKAYDLANETKTKVDGFGDIKGDVEKLQKDVEGKAPTSHATNTTTYGQGTSTDYGHVKLSDSTSDSSDASSGGTAATPKAVKEVSDKVSDLETKVEGKANKNHASDTEEYGLGDDKKYGHLKVIDDFENFQSSEDDDNANKATAASAKAVKGIKDSLESLKNEVDNAIKGNEASAPKEHASEKEEYGLGTSDKYGHLKITDNYDNIDFDTNGDDYKATAPSIKALAQVYEIVKKDTVTLGTLEEAMRAIGLSGVQAIDGQDLNSIINMGTYVSKTASLEHNYPYVATESLSLLSVSTYNYGLKTVTPPETEEPTPEETPKEAVAMVATMDEEPVESGSETGTDSDANVNTGESGGDSESENPDKEPEVDKTQMAISQILYSANSIYIRYSFDNGQTWKPFVLCSGSGSGDEGISIYISPTSGKDENMGTDELSPVKTWERVFTLLNQASNSMYKDKSIPNATIYLDKGEYTDIPEFSNSNIHIILDSFYYTPIEEEGTEEEGTEEEETEEELLEDAPVGEEEYEGDKIENKPHIPVLKVSNANVSVKNMKIDYLYADDNANVSIILTEYISIAHVSAMHKSTVYIGTLYKELPKTEEEIVEVALEETPLLPLLVHNVKKTNEENGEVVTVALEENKTPLFYTDTEATIFDTGSTIQLTEEITDCDYLFQLKNHSSMFFSNVKFSNGNDSKSTTDGIGTGSYSGTQYDIGADCRLYLTTDNFNTGTDTNNKRENNSFLNGTLWGGGTKKSYLRDDGVWSKIFDTNVEVVTQNKTLAEADIKKILLTKGTSIEITVPSIEENASFFIKNVDDTNTSTVKTQNVTIDGKADDIKLRPYEYIQIVQYVVKEENSVAKRLEEEESPAEIKGTYAIITDTRAKPIALMNMGIDALVMTTSDIKIEEDNTSSTDKESSSGDDTSADATEDTASQNGEA